MYLYSLASAPDSYPLPATDEPLNLFNYVPYNKVPVQPQALVPGENTAVWVALGQSTGACNTEGTTIYSNDAHFTPSSPKAQNFNVADGAIYPAATPLLGCQGFAGNWNARLTQKLIDLGLWQRVIVAPIGVGGTSVAQQAGLLFGRIQTLKNRLDARGLRPTFITYQQGEQDTTLGTSQASYAASGASLIAGIRALGWTMPLFIARTSFTGVATSSAVIAAQTSLIDPSGKVYGGPFTDTINGGTYRQNGGASPHLTAAGSQAISDAWVPPIDAVF